MRSDFIKKIYMLLVICSMSMLNAYSADVRKWTNRVIPLPKEVSIDETVTIPAGKVALEPCEVDGVQIPTALRLLETFAKGDVSQAKVVVSLMLIDANSTKNWSELAGRLKKVANNEQAYAISSSMRNGILRISLLANTPTGLLYATQTLSMMIRPPLNLSKDTKIEIPAVNIVDWPDMNERGEWGGYAKWDYSWFRRWKLNLIEINPRLGIDKEGKPIVRLERKKVLEAAAEGIKLVPFIAHLGSLGGNANLRAAIYDPKLKHLLPILGKPLSSDNGLCCSNPATVDLISDWAEQLMALVDGAHNELEIWFTEGGRHCETDREKTNGKPKLAELELMLKVFERVKKKYPKTRMRLWLSQGTYRGKVHDDIIKRLPLGVGLVYYNGTRTYISNRDPIVPENLSAFSMNGGFLGVVPQISHSWITVVPWTAPQFIHFRMKEFNDKKMNSISAYGVPGSRYFHEFNLMGVAEWAWNSKGRSPGEYAEAFATVMGMRNPAVFAEWALKAGSAGWELADSLFYSTLNYDPALGFHGDKPFDHRFAYEDTYKSQMDQALNDAERALEIAKQYDDLDMMAESTFTLDSLRLLTLTNSISELLRKPDLDSEQRSALANWMDRFDESSQKIASSLISWGKRQVPEDKGYVHGISRLDNTLHSMFKCGDVLRIIAAARGFADSRTELRPVKLGEWKTDCFKNGTSSLSFNITDLVNSDQWGVCGLICENTVGFKSYLSWVSLYEINPKTKEKNTLFEQRGSPWYETLFLPILKVKSGNKLMLEVRLSVICPKNNEFPDNKEIHGKGTEGNLYLRRLIKPEFVMNLPKTSPKRSETGVFVACERRLKNAPTTIAVFSGHGDENLVATLNNTKDMNAHLVTDLTPEILKKYQVVVIPQSSRTTAIIKYAEVLKKWVESGGGVLLIHDAVGFRRQMPLFRMIGLGRDNPKLHRLKVVSEHPVTEGIQIGKVFEPGFKYDHIAIEKGAGGVVLVTNDKDQPVMVAGKVGQGHVVLDGMMTGYAGSAGSAGGGPKAPEGVELKLFVNAVKWLAGTENLLTDPGAEHGEASKVNKTNLVAPGWGFYSSGLGKYEWGVTDKEAKSGKASMFLKFIEHGKDKKGSKSFGAGLMLGDTNGYSGMNAIKVEPNKRYGFSFWMKGTVPKVGIGLFFWDSEDGDVKSRRLNHPVQESVNLRVNGALVQNVVQKRGVAIPLNQYWTHYSGIFETGADTRRVAVRIAVVDEGEKLSLKGGECVYADDASIYETD